MTQTRTAPGRKKPLDLRILAWLSILNGLGIFVQFLLELPDPPAPSWIRLLGLFWIAAGIGLLRLNRPLRTLALGLVWFHLIAALVVAVRILADDDRADYWLLPIIAFPVWEFWVLVRPRNRLAFGIKEPIRPFVSLAKGAAAVLGVLVGIPAVINFPDTDLRSDVRAFLQFRPLLPSPERNGFFTFIGYAAPSDPHQAGLQLWHRLEAEINSPNPTLLDNQRYPIADALTFNGDKMSLCRPAENAWKTREFQSRCVAHYAGRQAEARTLLAANAALLQRYHVLVHTSSFAEPLYALDAYPWSFSLLSDAHYLAQAAMVKEFMNGNRMDAVARLRDSIAFWRRMMSGSCHLITKMVATRHLVGDLSLLLDFAQSAAADRALLHSIAAIARPLSPEERDASCAVRKEFLLHADRVRRAGTVAELIGEKPESAFLALSPALVFVKRDATTNLLHDEFAPWHRLAGVDARTLNEALRKPVPAMQWQWRYVYNMGGRVFVEVVSPGRLFAKYFQRVHDADAFARLVALQARIRASRVGKSKIQRFVDTAAPELHDPYTAAPMKWDGDKKQLYSQGLGDGKTRHAVAISIVAGQ